ncbi:hypothetical protein NG799_11950 [Laspinema sp. D1]|uniref:Restriction endonuclease n=1 Tax=Laspinema palackyanum D2a TaxID=2953684 RepID=A0ABT2MSU0_9CYAN|nr:hypothetical protein [Laspinema sp. D2a]
MNQNPLDQTLENILQRYSLSFSLKVFSEESATEDDLMRVFGLTQVIKAENKQYWGRELGMCWQRVVTEVCRENCEDFRTPIREGKDELCDLIIGLDAIDTKYRIGSGDAGTLKKFREYAGKLQGLGLTPILLILRTDNLPQAINACRMGGWTVMQGSDAYEYIRNKTGFELKSWLQARRNRYSIEP